MKKLAVAITAILYAAPSWAVVNCPPGQVCTPVTQVPEISAMEGTAALAVLAAVVLLAWERRRRAV